MERYDVAVVGAGLAGLQCARLLARRGLKVLLVDRKRSLDQAVHTTGIFVRRTLEDFDLPDDCLGPPVRHVTLYSPARRPLSLASRHDEFRAGRMGPLYLRLLDDCLQAGAAWAPGTRYAGAEPAGPAPAALPAAPAAAGATCAVSAPPAASILHLDTAGRRRSVRAGYIVGADGAVSRVARDLGLDVNRELILGVEDVLHGVPPAGPPAFHCFLDPALAPGYLAWLVHDGHEVHIGAGGYPGPRWDPLAALDRLYGVAGAATGIALDRRGVRRVERRGGRIPVGGVLQRIAGPRGLLAGDAAGAPSPLTAGGLDPCMRLSALAAAVIARYLDTGCAAALAPYDGARFRARFVSRRWMRRLLAGLGHPALLEAACAALRLPPLRPLAAHVFFGRGSFPDVDVADGAPVCDPV